MRFFLFLSAFSCILFSCKPKSVDYTISGKLVNGCDNSPVKNVKVQAIQTNIADGFNLSTVSDANGDFQILVSTTKTNNYRFLNLKDEVPLETVDYGNIPLYSNTTVYYKVKILDPHTTSDTLWIVDPSNTAQYYKMYAPFHDTIIGLKTVTTVNTLAYSGKTKQINQTNTINEIMAWYKINQSYYSENNVSIQTAVCNTIPDTLTLIVH